MLADCTIIIMCKAPVAGRVKTRLMTEYSAEEAMLWHCCMSKAVIHQAKRLFSRVIIAADQVDHPFFTQFKLPVQAQGEGDLGERLHRLMQDVAHEGHYPLIFVGADSPHMPDARLQQAARELGNHDVVIGPVEDGGYNLIGLSKPHQKLFHHIDWGTSSVYQQTLIQAGACSQHLLDTHYDIDTPQDLARAKACGSWWE